MLWKVNRFVSLEPALLGRIDGLRGLQPGEHEKARPVLEQLLGVRGVDLPMAAERIVARCARASNRRYAASENILPLKS